MVQTKTPPNDDIISLISDIVKRVRRISMAMTEKIRILLVKKNMKTTDLARLLGTKPSNLYNKFKRDNFSEKELDEIAAVLGCRFEGSFILETGEQV